MPVSEGVGGLSVASVAADSGEEQEQKPAWEMQTGDEVLGSVNTDDSMLISISNLTAGNLRGRVFRTRLLSLILDLLWSVWPWPEGLEEVL